jgi:hypothetical protein
LFVYVIFAVNLKLQAEKGFMLLVFYYTCGMTN